MLTAERLLEDRSWVGKLYSGGWSDGGGASLAVLDKATGESLADVVVAPPDDVARAVAIATEAQRAWAQTYAVEQRLGESGNGGRFGGHASFDEFTEWQWMTLRDAGAEYPF
jgi:benzaldehyde dehydrogenase (NAD)